MSAHTQPPYEDPLRRLDWKALHASARRLLRGRMSGFEPQEIEDAAQEVAKRMVEFVHRRGDPESPGGLLVSMVRAVSADAIARRRRDRTIITRVPDAEPLMVESPLEEEQEILEEYRNIAFHVLEYLRLRRASCLPLADAKSKGESLKDVAERLGFSYAQVRQAWARCVKVIHDAIRRRRLRIAWSLTSPASTSSD